jgi:hypothetical protein
LNSYLRWFSVFAGMGYLAAASVWAVTSINASNKYAYAANAGWVNAAGDVTNGVVVGETYCSGFMYGANFGWVNVGDGSPDNGTAYSNLSGTDYGVNLDPGGNLRGFAYAANVGWINFEAMGDPQVDLLTGTMSGSAYAANMGWISLSNAQAFVQTDHLEPGPDTDLDMIPDAWELSHTNDLVALSKMGDGDGDGASDLEEYLADTDPFDAGSLFAITATVLDPAMSESDVTWNSEVTRLYRVELNTDLVSGIFVDSGLGDVVPDAGSSTTRTAPLGGPGVQHYRANAIMPLAP